MLELVSPCLDDISCCDVNGMAWPLFGGPTDPDDFSAIAECVRCNA